MEAVIRPAAVAGLFYPAAADRLRLQMHCWRGRRSRRGCLEASEP